MPATYMATVFSRGNYMVSIPVVICGLKAVCLLLSDQKGIILKEIALIVSKCAMAKYVSYLL